MPTSATAQRDLIMGLPMTLPEFLRTWADLPEVQHAELIDGIVHVPRPRSALHSRILSRVLTWLGEYAARKGGVQIGCDETLQLLDCAPQPCAHLRRAGSPDLILELCETNTEVDFGPKLALYQRAGVKEYITVETLIPCVQWRVLDNGSYRNINPDTEGVLRSKFLPDLQLDAEALWDSGNTRLTH